MTDDKKDDGTGLWKQVTKTVRPLKARPMGKEIPRRKRIERKDEETPLPTEWQIRNAPTPQARIDRKVRRKITKGLKDVDRSVDLHGMTQDQAYTTLLRVIQGGIRRGDKVLLVVTGKGGQRHSQLAPDTPVAYRTRDDFEQFGGVLKRMVPIWLESHEMKPFVESYGQAAQEHGGDGALYVLLRRRLPGSRKVPKA